MFDEQLGAGQGAAESGAVAGIRVEQQRLARRISDVEQERAVIEVHMKLINLLFRRLWALQNKVAALEGASVEGLSGNSKI
jgi:hypothetical protein